jgi:hypothetical protein
MTIDGIPISTVKAPKPCCCIYDSLQSSAQFVGAINQLIRIVRVVLA